MSSFVGSDLIASKFPGLLASLSINRNAPILGVGGEQVLIGIHMHDGAAKGVCQFVGGLFDHLHGYWRFARVKIGHFTCFVQQMLL